MMMTQPMSPVDSSTSVTARQPLRPGSHSSAHSLVRLGGRRAQHRLMDHVVGTYRRVERADDQRPDLPRYAHQPLGLYVLPRFGSGSSSCWMASTSHVAARRRSHGTGVARAAVSALDTVLWVFEVLNIPAQNWRYFFDHPIDTNTLSGGSSTTPSSIASAPCCLPCSKSPRFWPASPPTPAPRPP